MKTIRDISNMAIEILRETVCTQCGMMNCCDCNREYCYFDSIRIGIEMILMNEY